MAVKYVKDFSFPSSGGFHGSVQRFAKGGHVTKVPAKAKASAKDMPARAKPNAPAKGAPKMASKPAVGKRQGYNEGGQVPGREMDRLPTKRPPGRMKDLAPARRFKGAYEGYEDGGEVYTGPPIPLTDDRGNPITYRPDDERPPPLPVEGPPPLPEPMPVDDYKPSGPPPPQGMMVNPNYGKPGQDYYISKTSSPAQANEGMNDFLREYLKRDEERIKGDAADQMRRLEEIRRQEMLRTPPRYMRDVETGLDRGMRPGQMARQQRIEDRVNAEREDMMRPRYRTFEMPDYSREYAMPVPGPGPLGVALPGMAMVAPPSPGRFAKGGKVQKVMREYKEGKLHSGSKKGPLVKSEKQAVAIALSEARKAGAKIPKKAEGGIFSTESMAYQSKGPKTRGTYRKGREQGRRERMERLAQERMEHAEKYAPGLSLDMPDRKKHGGMPVHRRKPMYGGGKC